MGWFSGQSKAAKELERKRQQERDEENAKKADDVCDDDPQRVLQLPEEFTEPETEDSLKKEANELLVCLLRGKNLPVMDKNVLSSGG